MLTKEEMQYKIDYEIIVDAYDEYEQGAGWAIFFQDHGSTQKARRGYRV